jgi:hypothetical protein
MEITCREHALFNHGWNGGLNQIKKIYSDISYVDFLIQRPPNFDQ